MGKISELINTHFVGTGFILIMFFDMFKILNKDLESIFLNGGFITSIESEFELLELIVEILELLLRVFLSW